MSPVFGHRDLTHPWQRDKLEKLCQYVARPAVSEERLTELPNGNILYEMKKAYSDGTTHLLFSPIEFMEKLTALVPPHRIHLTRFHGVLAPHCKIRSQVVPKPEAEDAINKGIEDQKKMISEIKADCSLEKSGWGDRSNLFWCQLFNSSIENDLLTMPKTVRVLLVHGQKDEVVPVEETYSIYSKMLSRGQTVRLKVFPDMDHGFFSKMPELLQLFAEWSSK